jgi:hypothetical protein
MKILGFYHICMINNWEAIVSEQVKSIVQHGLYNKTNQIMVGCLGSLACKAKLKRMLPRRFKIVFHSENIDLYEIPTLQYLHTHSQKEDFITWYIHTKGVFSGHTRKKYINVIKNWRKMMEYFVIEKHQTCLNQIQSPECDACGTEARYCGFPIEETLTTSYSPPAYHFAGNFWWSKSSHIKTLPNLYHKWLELDKSRYVAEAFIGMSPLPPRFYNFYYNFINLYEISISEQEYKKHDRLELFTREKLKPIKML